MKGLILPDSGAPTIGARRTAPSASRNLAPILSVLAQHLPPLGRALEIASGSGQHIAAFARAFPGIHWQPSDANADTLPSIAAWCAGLPNVAPPIVLDACAAGWAQGNRTSIHLTNLLHLIPESAAQTLLGEIARGLAPGGLALLYGPFRREGRLVSDGDVAFDASLRAQDPAIGYKDADWVEASLAQAGLHRLARIEMPASNLMLLARRPV